MLLDFPHVPWDDAEAFAELLSVDGHSIAGLIAEPITGAAGACLTPTDDYWRRITELCREHDVLLIADEVMCGYGRTGLTWGHQHFPLEPDVVVGGKGLGGGYVPIGAVATRGDIAELLSQRGFMFFTYSGNDLSCALAAAVLRILRDEQLVERAAEVGAVLGSLLHAEFDDHPQVLDVRGRGMFYGLELRCSQHTVVAEALRRDLWVYPAGSGPVASAVMVAPPFVITADELAELVARLRAALDAVG
jgi:adenosylmethionine-8-amino-7-oxononanoate aminotransferase